MVTRLDLVWPSIGLNELGQMMKEWLVMFS